MGVRFRVAPLVGALVVAALIAGAGASPAWGEDPGAKRQATSNKQQQVQGQLDSALASDAQVEAEVARLDVAVTVQTARLADARQAEQAAQQQADDAARQLAAVKVRVDAARSQLASRAVQAYIDPQGVSPVAATLQAKSLDEASRRQTLLSLVQARTSELVESLRAAKLDQTNAKLALDRAHQQAVVRTGIESKLAGALETTQRSQQALHSQLQARISDLQEESRQLASQESQLEALIKQRQAAAVQAIPPPPANPPSGRAAPGVVSGAGLMWPVRGPVTSEFGPRWGGFHPGIDIAPPAGTPIAAAKSGVVVFAGSFGGYGNFVVIDHGGGISTAYAHQSSIAVTQGQSVSQGQVIGYVGSTGFSTGPHLHFEVRVGGSPQDPRRYESGAP